MNASLAAKITIVLCCLCLLFSFISIDKHKPYVDEKTSKPSNGQIITNTNKIAVMELEGIILSSYENNLFSSEASAAGLLKSLQAAQQDNDIKGIIIKINSPGGTVGMSQNIYNQILKIRKTKPVIALMDDVAASGGYYIASAADRIIAQSGTLTGSIGVIFSFMNYEQLLSNKLGVNSVVIKSGKYKDMGSATRQITPEERALFQEIINDSYNQFVNAIKKGRIERTDNYTVKKTILSYETLKKNADGRVFTGNQAKQKGFIDETGDIDTAKDMIEKMCQEKYKNKLKAKLVTYNKKNTFSDYFSSFAEYNSRSNIKLIDFIPKSMILNRKPLYLWE